MHIFVLNYRPRLIAHRGMATLEFVLALPVLLLLMVGITWLGFSVIGQTEMLVEARNKAWQKRFDNAADNPLSFPILPEHDLPVLPKYKKDADYVTETASKKIDVSPVFNTFPGPEASHTVLAGSWDYNAMPLDTPPDFVLMGKAALIGTFGGVLDIASLLTDPLGLVKKFKDAKTRGSQIGNQIEDRQTQVGKGGESSGPGSGPNPGTGAGTDGKTPEQAKAEAEAELKKQKDRVQTRFKQLGGRINLSGDVVVTPVSGELEAAQDARIQAQLDRQAKSEAALRETDEERRKQAQEEAARAHRKAELTRITYERLEAECKDLVHEADAMDIERWELNRLLGVFL
jgi:hypothetical protein